MQTTWTVDRWSDKQGSRGLSIMRNGLAVANMVGQLDDSELALAKQIVGAMNKLESGTVMPVGGAARSYEAQDE